MAQWALMNPPAWRSKDNTRPGISAPDSTDTGLDQHTTSILQKQEQPPLFLMLERSSPTTTSLLDAVTNTPLYKIHDTGRGSISLKKKPDYEIFRCSTSDTLVGTIRFGTRKTEIKLPQSNRQHDDPEKFELQDRQWRWKTTQMSRPRRPIDRSKAGEVEAAPWLAEVECIPADDNNEGTSSAELCAAIKLFDTLPNGRVEIWTDRACPEVGGDWELLDELVTLAYANMETARRRVLSLGKDPAGVGIAGVGMVGGAMGMGGFGA